MIPPPIRFIMYVIAASVPTPIVIAHRNAGPDGTERGRMMRLAQFMLSLIFSGLLLYALVALFALPQAIASARQAHLSLLMVGAGLMVVAYLLRGARWRIWER